MKRRNKVKNEDWKNKIRIMKMKKNKRRIRKMKRWARSVRI